MLISSAVSRRILIKSDKDNLSGSENNLAKSELNLNNNLISHKNFLWKSILNTHLTNLNNTTVAYEKLEGMFLLNTSLNIRRRMLKPSAMDFYWPVWHFKFFYIFDLLSNLDLFRSTWDSGNDFPWFPSTYFLRQCYHILFLSTLNWKWPYTRKPHWKSALWVPIESQSR